MCELAYSGDRSIETNALAEYVQIIGTREQDDQSKPSSGTGSKRAKLRSILKTSSISEGLAVAEQQRRQADEVPGPTLEAASHKPSSVATCFDGSGQEPQIDEDGNQDDDGDSPKLFNYHGQVVTRSAMELLELEDEIAARGGLFERDGVVMTASALSLLQAQEAMARADTAGQGEWGRESIAKDYRTHSGADQS